MPTITCKNCEQHFKGNFCPHCSQAATVEHIGLKYFLHDIPHSIFHVDKGFKGHRLKYSVEFALICFFLAFIYITGMSLTGIMENWWE